MFSAEKINDNYNYNYRVPMSSSSSSTTDEQTQAAVSDSYLHALMQRLTLFDNNYQGDICVPLPHQYNAQSCAPNYAMNIFGTRFRCAQPAIRTQTPAPCHQYPISTSISRNGFNFQASNTQAHGIYPSIQDQSYGGFVNSIQFLMECIIIDPYQVMKDPKTYQGFMNLLRVWNKKVLNALLERMAEFSVMDLIEVSCHHLGSQVIKKLINVAKRVPNISLLPRVFASRIVAMANSQYGWPVIHTCLRLLDKPTNAPLYEVLVEHCLEIATDKYGCIAIQNYVDLMDSSPSQPWFGQDRADTSSPKERLFTAISKHAALLAQDRYGNFVMQFVIGRCPKDCLESIAVSLKPLYERLCTSGNGSYLVEKILDTRCRSHVVQALLESRRLVLLAQDEYGNYAIQTLLKQTKIYQVDDYHKLCKKLSLELDTLDSSLFGKNVARLLKEDEANEGERGCSSCGAFVNLAYPAKGI